MLFETGILGVLQVAVLPGLIFNRFFKFSGTCLQKLVYTFALSLLLNYCLVLVLVLLRIYLRPVFLGIILMEPLALVWLYRAGLTGSLADALAQAWNNLARTLTGLLPSLPPDEPLDLLKFLPLVSLALLVYSLSGLWTLVKVFVYNIGTVFSAWDVVVSWNKWAQAWASNAFPLDSRFYPQLVPLSWSSIYVAQGNADIQFFAHAIMPLFALGLVLLVLDLGLRYRRVGFFVALVLTNLLLKKFFSQEISNGYVDVAVAFFGFLPLHALLNAREDSDPAPRRGYLLLGAIFAAGAALAKQSGVYILALYPLLAWLGLHRPAETRSGLPPLRRSLAVYALIALVPAAWYIFRLVLNLTGVDRAETADLVQIASAAYGRVSLLQQMLLAFGRFERYIFLFLLILLALPLVRSFYRWLVLLVILPYPLLWAWGASYDTRNLAFFMPWFALVSGVSIQALLEFLLKILQKLGLVKTRSWLAWAVLLLGLLAAGMVISSNRLVERQNQLELQNFSPAINQKVFEIVKREGPGTKFLTNYPLRLLPGLENNQLQFSFRDYQRFLQYAADPAVKYMLVPSNQLDPQIKTYIDAALAAGKYRLILADDSWLKFSLVEVLQR